MPSRLRSTALGAALALAGLLLAGPAGADEPSALALVRAQWFEGIPPDRARAVTPAGAAAIAALLQDPGEAEHHAAALEVLGIAGHPGAFEAVSAYLAQPPSGELDAAGFRAQLAALTALGPLARSDDRALDALLDAEARSGSPGWSYRHLSGPRLRLELRRRALHGLGVSGRPAARTRLAQRAGDDAAPAGVRSAAEAALAGAAR